MLEDWKQGQLAKGWKLRSVLGEWGYEIYKEELDTQKSVEEYEADMFGERTHYLKRFGQQYVAWANFGNRTEDLSERLGELLSEMTDEERLQLTDGLWTYDIETGHYAVDGVWLNENRGELRVFKGSRRTSYTAKRTLALIRACESLIEGKHDADATEDSEEKVDLKGTLAERLARLKAE